MAPPFQSPTTASGLRAARAAALSERLPVDDLRLLSARGNLVVHLAPATVVARVATLTAWSRRDPVAWLERELVVAGHAATRGAAVIAPADGVDPGPHVDGEHPVTLWTFHDIARRRPTPAQAGASLAALHAACADLPADLPWMTPVHDQIDDTLPTITRRALLPADRRDALRRRHAEVLADLPPAASAAGSLMLHGDAHGRFPIPR